MEFWGQLLMLSLSWLAGLRAQNAPDNSFFYMCNPTAISLAVKSDPLANGLKLDPSGLSLGTCHASSTTALRGYIVFEYKLSDCSFTLLAYGSNVKYFADLDYQPSRNPDYQYKWEFKETITCVYNRTLNPTIPSTGPLVAQLAGEGRLSFSADIMKDDFTGPSDNKEFYLGSLIPVELSVATGQHQSMLIYVDECIAATAPNLQSALRTYSIIQNHGCFIDGMDTASTFKKRFSPNSIRLTIEALRFIDLDDDIYLHFKVVVWDPKAQNDATKKACSYLRDANRWELLDNPTLSSLCSCCDSVCIPNTRKRRDVNGAKEDTALVHKMVLGPFKIHRQDWDGNVSKTVHTTPGYSIPPAVGALLMEVAILLVLSVGVLLYNRRGKNREIEVDPLIATGHHEDQPK